MDKKDAKISCTYPDEYRDRLMDKQELFYNLLGTTFEIKELDSF